MFFNIKEIEKLKLKSEYVKENNLWYKLSQEQKQFIINKYIDEIEINSDCNHNISILNIIFNKNEIENIGLMFRNDCFDMAINVNDKNIILSDVKNEKEIKNYIESLRNFYNINETIIELESFDITEFDNDKEKLLEFIPKIVKGNYKNELENV